MCANSFKLEARSSATEVELKNRIESASQSPHMKMLGSWKARQRAQRSVTTLLKRSGCNSVIGVLGLCRRGSSQHGLGAGARGVVPLIVWPLSGLWSSVSGAGNGLASQPTAELFRL